MDFSRLKYSPQALWNFDLLFGFWFRLLCSGFRTPVISLRLQAVWIGGLALPPPLSMGAVVDGIPSSDLSIGVVRVMT